MNSVYDDANVPSGSKWTLLQGLSNAFNCISCDMLFWTMVVFVDQLAIVDKEGPPRRLNLNRYKLLLCVSEDDSFSHHSLPSEIPVANRVLICLEVPLTPNLMCLLSSYKG